MIGVYFSFNEIKFIGEHFRKLRLNKKDRVLADQILEKIDEAKKFYNL